MILYFCNLFGVSEIGKYLPDKIDILVSYYGLDKVTKPPFCRRLFLDSGAFSAFKKNESIPIKEYANFIKNNINLFTFYANLDDIRSPEKSEQNQKYLEKSGLAPVPCFHYNEPIKFLEQMASKYSYIALGGLVPIAGNIPLLFQWLDYCWGKLLHVRPKIQVHGFGINGMPAIERYPWHSVDASSIHMQARYGGIRTPWGWMKINSNVKDTFALRYQKNIVFKVKEWFDSLHLSFTFDEAREATPEGTNRRIATSVIYFNQKIIPAVFSKPFQKRAGLFDLQ